MKSLQSYITEQLLLEKGHIANKEEIQRISKDITDFCIREYTGDVGDTAYDFQKGSFFYDKLKFVKIQFNHFKTFTACMYVYSPSLDEILNIDDFEKQYEISGYKAKYYILKINIDKLPNNDDTHGIDRLYSAIAHELTHLYQFLNGMKMSDKDIDVSTDKGRLSYLLDKSEMEARINQVYHLVIKKWGDSPEQTKSIMDDFEISETDMILDLVKRQSDIDKATQMSITQKLINKCGTDKQKKTFEQYKKKIYRVVYDAFEEILKKTA